MIVCIKYFQKSYYDQNKNHEWIWEVLWLTYIINSILRINISTGVGTIEKVLKILIPIFFIQSTHIKSTFTWYQIFCKLRLQRLIGHCLWTIWLLREGHNVYVYTIWHTECIVAWRDEEMMIPCHLLSVHLFRHVSECLQSSQTYPISGDRYHMEQNYLQRLIQARTMMQLVQCLLFTHQNLH